MTLKISTATGSVQAAVARFS